jgi:hypothetical protein
LRRGLRGSLLHAYKTIFDWYRDGEVLERVNLDTLTLLAGCVWLLNSLHATPDTGRSSRRLINAILPHIPREESDDSTQIYRTSRNPRGHGADEDEDENEPRNPILDLDHDQHIDLDDLEDAVGPLGAGFPVRNRARSSATVPAAVHGMIFTRTLVLSTATPVPRLAPQFGSQLGPREFAYFYGTNFKSFAGQVFQGTLTVKSNPGRTHNRTAIRHETPPPVPDEELLFLVPEVGDLEIPPETDWYVTDPTPIEDGPAVPSTTWNQRLTFLYRRVFPDVTILAPNPKPHEQSSYCTKDPESRAYVTEDDFADPNLANFFRSAIWKVASEEDWATAFKHLFPPTDTPKGTKSQGYIKSTYYKMWMHFVRNNTPEVVTETRDMIYQRFRKNIVWFPWVKSDRIWYSSTKTFTGRRQSPNIGPRDPGPQILAKKDVFFSASP